MVRLNIGIIAFGREKYYCGCGLKVVIVEPFITKSNILSQISTGFNNMSYLCIIIAYL